MTIRQAYTIKIIPLLLIVLCYAATLVAQPRTPTQPVRPSQFVLGEMREIYAQTLRENRLLNIYLPQGYTPTDSTRYPVIYLLDGSADEDFIHVVGLVQFNSVEWVNRLPKSIVVGIANVDRRRDFTFPTTIEADKKKYPSSGHSDQFIAFIEQELQPYIQAHYKTTTKTLIGQSLGGLLATQILLTRPALFTTYIIVSPSLWWNNGSLLDQPVPALLNADIYIGVGKEGLTPTAIPRVMEVDANLLADKIKSVQPPGGHVYFDYLPGEDHATIMHQALVDAFKRLATGATQR